MKLGCAVAMLLVGCSVPDRSGGTPDGNSGSGGDAAACVDVVDVVFVLDVSSSMGFVLDQLGQQIPKVVEATLKVAPDPHFGLVAFVDNDRVDATGANGMVHLQAASLQSAFSFYRAHYTDPNRNPADDPNTGPSPQNPLCEENALDALYDAATVFPWRENATRVVIVATDDTFIEAPDNYGDRDGDGQFTHTGPADYPYYEGNYPAKRVLSDTVGVLKDRKIRVFSFTSNGTGGTCGRGNSTLTGFSRFPASSIPNGWSQPYKGAPAIPVATSGKNFDLAGVKTGTRSLADTINEVVVDSHCNPIFE